MLGIACESHQIRKERDKKRQVYAYGLIEMRSTALSHRVIGSTLLYDAE